MPTDEDIRNYAKSLQAGPVAPVSPFLPGVTAPTGPVPVNVPLSAVQQSVPGIVPTGPKALSPMGPADNVDLSGMREQAPSQAGAVAPVSPQSEPGYQSQMAARPVYVPGKGWVNSSRQRQEGGTGEDVDRSRELMDAGGDLHMKAIDEAAKVGEEKAVAQQAFAEKKALIDQEQAAHVQRLHEEKKQRVDEQLQKLSDVTDAYEKGHIDPNRYKNSMGTFSKIFSVIGIGLGGGASSATMHMMDNAINADIDAQKAELDVKKGAVANRRNLLNDMTEHFGSQEAGEIAMRNIYLQSAQSQLDATLAKNLPAEARANATQMRASVADQMAASREKLATLTADHVTTAQQFDRGGYVSGPAKAADVNDERIVKLPDGRAVQVKTKEEGITQRAKVEASLKIDGMLTRAKKIREEIYNNPTDIRENEARAGELERIQSDLIPLESVKTGQGTTRDPEYARGVKNKYPITEGLNVVTRLFNPKAERILDSQIDQNKRDMDDMVGAGAGERVQTGYAVDPRTGRVAPDAQFLGKGEAPRAIDMPAGFKSVGGKNDGKPSRRGPSDDELRDTARGHLKTLEAPFAARPSAPPAPAHKKGHR